MIYDTNLLVGHIRQRTLPPAKAILSVITTGELEALSLKLDWGIQRVLFMRDMIARYPVVDITPSLVRYYAEVDAFSQGRLSPLPLKMSARNTGKNDIRIAAIALFLDMELHTTDGDFDHLPALGLRLVKH